MIPFTEVKTLSRLFALAEAKEGGKLKQYRVANTVAQAIKFRLATFTGSIDAATQDGKQAWLVNFTLREHLSVAEKRDIRADSQAKAKKRGGKSEDDDEKDSELSWGERVLKSGNDALGKVMGWDK